MPLCRVLWFVLNKLPSQKKTKKQKNKRGEKMGVTPPPRPAALPLARGRCAHPAARGGGREEQEATHVCCASA